MAQAPEPEPRQEDPPATLGGLLFSNDPPPSVSEREWIALVQAIADGDQRALRALYRRMQRIVFTFLVKISRSREIAEELTRDVFREIWRRPSVFYSAGGSVVGWMMNLARSRAVDRFWFDQRRKLSANQGAAPSEALELDDHHGEMAGNEDILCPPAPLWERIARRIVAEGRGDALPEPTVVNEPDWADAAPGISYQILTRDVENERVGMLVRLAPRAAYPPHIHAGVEELYVLHGELIIDGRALYPGAYHRAEPGTGDQHVWSENGCTCVLLTSSKDILRQPIALPAPTTTREGTGVTPGG